MNRGSRVSAGCRFVLVVSVVAAHASVVSAGPQHWGFGFSYLAAIEEVEGVRRLVVYEPPLRAKDGVWLSRWIDRTTTWTDAAPGGTAVGNFWPSNYGVDHLVTVSQSGGSLYVRVHEPPACFGVRQWTQRSLSKPIAATGTFLGAAAGDLLGMGRDQLLVAMRRGGGITIVILMPPASSTGILWTNEAEAPVPGFSGDYVGIACGDFWNEDCDHLALATLVGGATQLGFYSYKTGVAAFSLVTTDGAIDLPAMQANGLTAADYEKDGFDVLTLASAAGGFQLRVAPAKPGQAYNPGPEYNGRAYSGQWLPGNSGASSRVVMNGSFGTAADSRVAFAAGRLFGYVNTDLNDRHAIDNSADAQITFMHRSPRKDECGQYGWPSAGQTVTYEINLSNNGTSAIPAGTVRLKVWFNRANRNADTDPATCDAPDFDQVINEPLPAYNPNAPAYVMRSVSFPWPYGLIPAGPRATWQKLNLDAVGERWVIAVIERSGESNLRDNRYEAAVHGVTFHPVFRTQSSLADRQPTVLGDPPSKEYLSRKLADAVQCMWERSRTRDGQDVLQRLWFDSYEIGWPDDQPDPGQAWAIVQSRYEGWRELDGWWGQWQGWERFNWGDGGAELHETGHLFHPIGDLYQYFVNPTFTGPARMADGRPVQLNTWVWTPDSFGSGHTIISWPACEVMKRVLVGVRNQALWNWESLAPDNTYVRVLDRDGNPVPGAEVTLWTLAHKTPYATGVTGADGRWDTTPLWGSPTIDTLGRKHYFGAADNGLIHVSAQVFTVSIGGRYADCAIWGTEEDAPHSRHTYMGHSFSDEASWTWDFHTNYKSGSPEPGFALAAAVQGSAVKLGVTGAAGATYRLYRKWEPAYIRTYLGEYAASGAVLTIPQEMSAPDSFPMSRFRAIYEVTEVTGGTESLPRSVQVTGLNTARGLATRGDGKLLVAANAGYANPFGQVFEGTTPYQELFYHYRWGHTANKVVPSRVSAGKYYATLAWSDQDPDYRFDRIDAPSGAPFTYDAYDVRNDIAGLPAKAFSASSPCWIQCNSADEAALYLPGDRVMGPDATARVTQVTGDTIYIDGPAFQSGQTNMWFTGYRLAGVPGSNASMRELNSARGLDTFLHDGNEYIAIADTGNRRVVVWAAGTAYVTHWQSPDADSQPAGIAAHPTEGAAFFMIDRRTSGTSKLYLFTFNGSSLSVNAGYPVDVAAGDVSDPPEMGLAAAVHPTTGKLMLFVTDARGSRVLQMEQTGGVWQLGATYTQAAGVYAGDAALSRPGDVACVRASDALRVYATDRSTRVVLLSEMLHQAITGDFDDDGDVDLADFMRFQACFNGPNRPASSAGCGNADFDRDADVDLADFLVFQGCFNGPDRPPACSGP